MSVNDADSFFLLLEQRKRNREKPEKGHPKASSPEVNSID
jgi:hypothetical protein